MAQTRKQLSNLRRGGGTAESARKAAETRRQHRADDARLEELAREDRWEAYKELHAAMARHSARLLRNEDRTGGKADPATTQRLKEVRLGLEVLTEYEARTNTAESRAGEFFSELESRMGDTLEALATAAEPITEPPTETE